MKLHQIHETIKFPEGPLPDEDESLIEYPCAACNTDLDNYQNHITYCQSPCDALYCAECLPNITAKGHTPKDQNFLNSCPKCGTELKITPQQAQTLKPLYDHAQNIGLTSQNEENHIKSLIHKQLLLIPHHEHGQQVIQDLENTLIFTWKEIWPMEYKHLKPAGHTLLQILKQLGKTYTKKQIKQHILDDYFYTNDNQDIHPDHQ